MNPTAKPAEPDPARWEVATASHTPAVSYYYVVHSVSNEAVRVIVASRKKKRIYTFNEAGREKEEVPGEMRREIDKALVRYLTS
jgi:hypothetical protein